MVLQMTEKQKQDFIKELENIRGRINAQIDNCIQSVLNGDDFPACYQDETWMASSAHHYKGKKPAVIILPSGEELQVKKWLEVVKIILDDCNSDPVRHTRLMEICGKVHGKMRTIFAPTPDGMVHPIQVGNDEMYFEAHFDTETLFNTLINRVLRYTDYDYHKIRIRCRSRIKRPE